MDEELSRFKTEIDLRVYAVTQGYALDARESWRGTAVMRRDGDKIVINRDADGHYVYFSVRDDRDNGTIIDFVKNRQKLTLGAIRQELRRFLNLPSVSSNAAARRTSPSAPDPLPVFAPLEVTSKDRLKVEAAYRRMRDLAWHDYLENERGIPRDVLLAERFAGRIRVDARSNAVFPHFDEEGLCGYELKNRDFTGFAAGGAKGLWASHDDEDDDRLVFAESAIDALSYAALHPDAHARYCSIGGKLNPTQPGLIRAAIAAMLPGSWIIAAMDADDAGRVLSGLIARAVDESGRDDVRFLDHAPDREGCDWNDVLRESSRSPALSHRTRLS